MSGRVTIMCDGCGDTRTQATVVNFYGSEKNKATHAESACAVCAESFKMMTGNWESWDYFLPLVNPGTCSESDVLAVECAMDAIARLLRCFDRTFEIDGKVKTLRRDEADVARLRAAAEAVKGKYYVPCPDPRCALGFCDCNGTGLVLRRRSDGTAVIDEIDAGSVAA